MILDAVFTKDLFTIRRYGPGPKDQLGKPTKILVYTARANGLLQQNGSVEGEGFVVGKYTATLAVGTDIRADDEVDALGMRMTVEGAPFTTRAPGMPSFGIVLASLRYVGPVTP